MTKAFIYIYFVLVSVSCMAQQKSTFASYEVGITADNIKFSSNDASIKMLHNGQAITGLTFKQEVKGSFLIEIGIYDKYLGADFRSYTPDTTNLVFAANTIQLPLRVVLRKKLFSDRLQIYPNAGISYYLTHSFSGIEYSYGNSYLQIEGKPFKNNYFTFDIGCSLNYSISENFSLGIVYRYTSSFRKVADYQINTKRPDGTTTEYKIGYSGITNNFMINAQYRISSWWD